MKPEWRQLIMDLEAEGHCATTPWNDNGDPVHRVYCGLALIAEAIPTDGDLTHLFRAFDETKEALYHLGKELAESTSGTQDYTSEIEDLRGSLHDAKDTIDMRDCQIAELEAQASNLNAEVLAMEDQLGSMEQRLVEAEQRYARDFKNSPEFRLS